MRILFQFVIVTSLFVSSLLAKAVEVNLKEIKHQTHAWVIGHSGPDFATEAPSPNDLAINLVDQYRIDNLASMEFQNLFSAKLSVSPWSGYYWPMNSGLIANRYADPNYLSAGWQSNSIYLEKVLGAGEESLFSPSEKYDLLVGNADFQLSKKMIQAGQTYADSSGNIPLWYGICHGWSPASFMLPRPNKSVKVIAADGKEITFTPSDIKALGSLLWANGESKSRMISGRCEKEDPETDASGRVIDPDCRDTNPATWHLAIVNQIAIAKRSLVLDVQSTAEVWNQPVYGYEYSYRNPITKVLSKKLQDAKVDIKKYRNDPYATHRSRKTRSIVDISMSLDYLSETMPSSVATDDDSMDSHRTIYYEYDLELDEHDTIVGGEWHSNEHPDFLWTPVAGTKAISEGDKTLIQQRDLNTWNGKEPIPRSWQSAAAIAAEASQPLGRVVETLFQLANQ